MSGMEVAAVVFTITVATFAFWLVLWLYL